MTDEHCPFCGSRWSYRIDKYTQWHCGSDNTSLNGPGPSQSLGCTIAVLRKERDEAREWHRKAIIDLAACGVDVASEYERCPWLKE